MNLRALIVVIALYAQPVIAAQTPAAGQDDKPPARPAGKAQNEMASKTARFGTVAKKSADYRNARDAKDLADAKKRLGQRAAFRGTVAQVFSPKGHSVVLLNFAKDYQAALTAAVRKEQFGRFPDLNSLKGKDVVVTGPVVDYKGRPELELTSPEQVRLVR